jgi:hypothetical protein
VSNLCQIPENRIVFGDADGSIFLKGWEEQTAQLGINLARSPITTVQYLKNFGTPLIFAGNDIGDVFFADFSGTSMNLKNAFRTIPTVGTAQIHHRVSEFPMRLYSYTWESPVIASWDLRHETELLPIKPKTGPVRCLEVLECYSDYVVVGSDHVEVFDLRESTDPVIVKELESPPMAVRLVDNSGPTFAVGGCKSWVSLLDLRYEGMRTSPYFGAHEVDSTAFAASGPGMTAALSHECGITITDLNNWKQETLAKLSRLGNKIPDVSAMLWNETSFSLAFVHEGKSIVPADL